MHKNLEKRERLSHEALVSLLSYDPATGLFVWKKNMNNNGALAGMVAGTMRKSGHITISIGRVQFFAHELAWFYMRQCWPQPYTDHINRDPSDNRIANLREVTRGQNNINAPMHKNNRSGARGIVHHAKTGKFLVYCGPKNTKRFWGSFATLDEARARYTEVTKALYGMDSAQLIAEAQGHVDAAA